MVDEADERWVDEHGFLSNNPLLDEILRVSDLLLANPQIGVIAQFDGQLERLGRCRHHLTC